MRSISYNKLSKGMIPCTQCINDGKYAYTTVNEYLSPDNNYEGPWRWMICHWCDHPELHKEGYDCTRYLHGHTSASSGNRTFQADTREAVIAKWNNANTPISKRFKSVFWQYAGMAMFNKGDKNEQ